MRSNRPQLRRTSDAISMLQRRLLFVAISAADHLSRARFAALRSRPFASRASRRTRGAMSSETAAVTSKDQPSSQAAGTSASSSQLPERAAQEKPIASGKNGGLPPSGPSGRTVMVPPVGGGPIPVAVRFPHVIAAHRGTPEGLPEPPPSIGSDGGPTSTSADLATLGLASPSAAQEEEELLRQVREAAVVSERDLHLQADTEWIGKGRQKYGEAIVDGCSSRMDHHHDDAVTPQH